MFICRGVIMFGLGSQELIIILVIVVVLFGAKRLPQLGAGLGKGITNFKKGLKGQDNDQIDTPEDKEV
jgi:sec-independent protein translocase protein TatA